MTDFLDDPRFAGMKPFKSKVWLSSPTMHGDEQRWSFDSSPVEESLVEKIALEEMTAPTDELEFDSDSPAEEIELWQPEEVDIFLKMLCTYQA